MKRTIDRFVLILLFGLSISAQANTVETDAELRQLLLEAIDTADSFKDRFDAEVWLVDMSNRLEPLVKDDKHRLHILREVHREATRVGLAPELVLALIEIESHFDRFAVSKSGAQGLMQIMPFWLDEIGRPEDNLINVKTNLRMGVTILKYYLDLEKNNLKKALARYNGSQGKRIYGDKVLEALHTRWNRR